MKEEISRAPLLDHLRQLADALLQRLPLLLERGAHLFLGRERHLAFGQAGVGGVALLAQVLQSGGQRPRPATGRPVRAFRTRRARAASAARFCSAFLFLRGQALNLVNDGVDLLVQQALGILQRIELAFVRGDGHFLGAQLGLRLLQAGLQVRSARSAARRGLRLTSATSLLQFRQRRLQLGDLVLAAQDRGRRLAVAVAVDIAAGVNAVPAQQLAARA